MSQYIAKLIEIEHLHYHTSLSANDISVLQQKIESQPGNCLKKNLWIIVDEKGQFIDTCFLGNDHKSVKRYKLTEVTS